MKGPTVTLDAIEANIASEHYFTALDGATTTTSVDVWHDEIDTDRVNTSLGLLTICVLVLRNGFTVLGTSACAAPENFDAEMGRKIARMDAVDKVWPLMGYTLKTQLAMEAL